MLWKERLVGLSRKVAAAWLISLGLAVAAPSGALAQRGMLDDVPLTKEKPAVPQRGEVPFKREEAPAIKPAPPERPPERMAIPRKVDELEGCWHSESGELPVVHSQTGRRVGTSRNCFCFTKDGRGAARIIYTSQNNVPVRGRGKVCEGPLTTTIGPNMLTFQFPGMINCTDGGKFATKGPVTWVCNGTQDGKSSCVQQPPYGSLHATYIRVGNDYCGWNG